MKEEVLNWLKEGCNFNAGLAILAKYQKNKGMIRIIAGKESRYASKLRYELLKLSGLQLKEIPSAPERIMYSSLPTSAQPPALTKSEFKTTALPQAVQDLIKKHSEAFNSRAILHAEMSRYADDNSDKLVAKRKELSEKIRKLSATIELLWDAKEDFYSKGIIPDLTILIPAEPPTQVQQAELPLDADELKKMKQQLQKNLAKIQNRINYSQETKLSKPNPMPDGPKRLKLELHAADLTSQIETLDYKLLECNS